MFTDIVGYTAFGQVDEAMALKTLDVQRNLLRPLFAKHGGREVKTMGDAFLVEFGSALEAVLCAVDVQGTIHSNNLEHGEELKIRIGIHLGDVFHQGGDVLGDAVNVASRIESMADPGGICISQQVQDHVKNKISYQTVKLEAQKLKNVAGPIDVYRVVMPWTKDQPSQVDSSKKTRLDTSRIAILPLVNMSSDREDEFFADGLTEELISTTSSIAGLTLIARTSVMGYKGTIKTVEEIGKELSVGTVLEGSVRKAGSKLRITVQLIDVQSQGHLWGKTYDRNFDDIFAVQGDIAMRVSDALRVQILPSETSQIGKRQTKSTEAHTLYLRGRFYWNERSKMSLFKAVECFREATRVDSEYALAYSGIADCNIVLGNHRYIPPVTALSVAKENASRAVKVDDSCAEGHTSLASVMSAEYDWEAAEGEFKKALELKPSYATGHHWYGVCLYNRGRFEESLQEALLAQALDPLSLQIPAFRALVYAELGKYSLAEDQIKKVLDSEPDFVPGHTNLRWVYFLEGKYGQAEFEAREILRLTRDAPGEKAYLAAIYASAGKAKEARRILDEVSRIGSDFVSNYPIILTYLGLGDKEKAIELVRKEYQEHADWLPELAFSLPFESIRSDSRVVEILRKIGLR